MTVSFSFSQETNSNVSGIIRSDKNELMAGATVTAIHESTKNTYRTQSRKDGYFYFSNLRPGGPYSVSISFTGFQTIEKKDLYIGFNSSENFIEAGGNSITAFILKEKEIVLPELTLSAKPIVTDKSGAETSIGLQKILSLPSINRNLQDFVRLVPQSKVNGLGMMSLAGQNSKLNAFFIDGSNNNDILGIAISGTNGGQTNTPPISIEALDEIKVLIAPYDVQYSNFTGGSINAITRSGSNDLKSSLWYYFRNENMTGRSPIPIENPEGSGIFGRPKLSSFFNQTFGTWFSGPIIKNKLFYFISLEKHNETRPQPFNFSQYRGNSNAAQILALTDTLRKKYNYDPGSFLEINDKLDAIRTIAKIDWNPSVSDKITFSYRYNLPIRTTPRAIGSTQISFQNSGFKLLARTHASSLEWKHFFKKDISNRFLFTYTNQQDDRQIIGDPFPQVSVTDGAGTIIFGNHASSHLNLFKASDFTVFDILKFVRNKNIISLGADLNFSKLNDLAINGYLGNYQFRNLNDFLNGQSPVRYTRSFPLNDAPTDDNTDAGAKFHTLRLGFFINNEINVNKNLKLTFGLRVDGNMLPDKFDGDSFFNDTASKIISNYYDLEDARSGSMMKPHWQIAPRAGFTYKIPAQKMTLSGGAGLYTGRILNLWASSFYNTRIGNIDISPQLYGLNFIPDPYNQPNYQTLGFNSTSAKGTLTLVSKNFKYPVVFRSTLSAEKKTTNGWTFTTEAVLTKNIHEWRITNVNILPPSKQSAAPGSRFVYSLNNSAELIPLLTNGSNPYTNISLLSNNKNKKGFAYSLSLITEKMAGKNFYVTTGYSYGVSYSLFEPYSVSGPLSALWAPNETINGKNFLTSSVSDVDPGHRFYLSVSKKIEYGKQKTSTTFSIFYNGQSGQPYSYVYAGSMVNDNNRQANFDLLYIPTKADLNTMIFISNTVNGVTYSGQQQKDLLNNYIEADRYLKSRRGQFAERNGSRLPFAHIVDFRVQQDFNIRLNRKKTVLSIVYDVFNFTNMLNKQWGRIYSLSSDLFPLIRFAGFSNNTTLTPQYQFTPFAGKPYTVQPSTVPGNSARWTSQLGFRINFN